MRDSKKAVFSILAFVLAFILIAVIILEPYVNSELYYYNDRHRRNALAGSVDYEIIGASHSLTAFIPAILDDKLNCNSYNLSGSLMTWKCRSALVCEELDRNPVNTLVLEVSYNAMVLPEKETESNIYTYPRISSPINRIKFLIDNQSLSEIDLLFADMLNSGIIVWEGLLYKIYKSKGSGLLDIISTPYKRDLNYENKGFFGRRHADVALAEDEVSDRFATERLNTDFTDYNIAEMEKIIKICKEKDIKVILTIVPISDSFIWRHTGWDDFQTKINELGKDSGCPFYDFNLIKDRYELFSDETSFSDETHLCENGAEIFSNLFCDVILKAESSDVTDLFYPNYSEMISDSPYMQYMKGRQ